MKKKTSEAGSASQRETSWKVESRLSQALRQKNSVMFARNCHFFFFLEQLLAFSFSREKVEKVAEKRKATFDSFP